MKRTQLLIASIAALSLSAFSHSQAPPEAKQLAQEVVELSMSDTLMQGVRQSTSGMVQQMQKQFADMKLNAKQQEIMQKNMSEFMDDMLGPEYMGRMRVAMVEAFAETYSVEELRGIRDFYRSPSGIAFIQKTPQAMNKAMPAMHSAIEPMMARLKARSEKLMKDLEAAK
jgi:uncharacterized protein